MNRRNFLLSLGVAALGAASTKLLDDDPDRLLWVPGAKKIIDLGATKTIEAPTDAQMAAIFDAHKAVLLAPEQAKRLVRRRDPLDVKDRDIRLTIMSDGKRGTFKYKGDTLISVHSAEELKLLDAEMWPNLRRG